jgi:hypothetical protein
MQATTFFSCAPAGGGYVLHGCQHVNNHKRSCNALSAYPQQKLPPHGRAPTTASFTVIDKLLAPPHTHTQGIRSGLNLQPSHMCHTKRIHVPRCQARPVGLKKWRALTPEVGVDPTNLWSRNEPDAYNHCLLMPGKGDAAVPPSAHTPPTCSSPPHSNPARHLWSGNAAKPIEHLPDMVTNADMALSAAAVCSSVWH